MKLYKTTDFYKQMADHYSKYDKVVWATWNDESALRLDYIKLDYMK